MSSEREKTKKSSKRFFMPQGRPFAGLPFDELGASAVIVMVLLTVLVAFAGLVIDVGHLFVVRSTLQNAADSASMAAVGSLSYGPEEARNQALLLAQQHGVDGSSVNLIPADIELGVWDPELKEFTVLAPAEEANADSVRVTAQRSSARQDPVSLFFMPVLGHHASDVKVVSVAHAHRGLCGAILGVNEVNISSSATTDSYNSNDGPYSPATAGQNGDVCSCGDINLNSSAGVNGDATPGPNNTVNLNSSAYVTGSTDPGGCPDLPPIDFGDVATNNDNGNIVETDKGEDPWVDGPAKGEFELSSGDSITLPGGTYYFSQFEMGSNSTVTFTGPTVIYVTGSFNVSSASIVNETQNPEDLIIMVSSNDVKLNSNADFIGVVYAPNTTAFINSSSHIYGTIMADEVDINSSVQVHYDEALHDNAFLYSLLNTGSSGFSSFVLVQ